MLLREKIVNLEKGFLAEHLAGVKLLCPILGPAQNNKNGKDFSSKILSTSKIVHNSKKALLKTKMPANTDTCQEGELMQQQQSYGPTSCKPASCERCSPNALF